MHRAHPSIRELAYQLWVDRGCPHDGSAEQDWLEAERRLSEDTYPASDPPSSRAADAPARPREPGRRRQARANQNPPDTGVAAPETPRPPGQ